MSSNELPLPYGWVQEYDSNMKHPFYVDTKSKPPRSIWTHPYEDEQYLSEHPEVREKVGDRRGKPSSRPSVEDKSRRHSYHGQTSSGAARHDKAARATGEEKRGMLGKLKDKAIGTKAERDERKRNMAIMEARAEEQRRQRRLSAQTAYGRQNQGVFGDGRYGAPMGNPYGLAGRRGGMGMGGMGMGGMGMPLMGGMAGGLLLGEMLGGDGFGGDGGGFGGDGGGFGGDGGGFGGDGGGFGGDGGGFGGDGGGGGDFGGGGF